jgi:predicted SprT family Zn-dependent metalloprotease
MPTISFDLVGTTAGRAYLDTRHVQLNAVLLTENLEKFESVILAHELAHILVKDFTGTKGGHGPVWQDTMRRLGLRPDRTHALDVTNARTTAVVHGYVCRCGPHPLTERMHATASQGRTFYKCGRCKTRISWVGSGGTVAPKLGVSHPAPDSTRPPPPPRPAAPAREPRPPSEAMLRFATSLAKKHSLVTPADVLDDFELCRQFLEKWAKASVGTTLPVPPAVTPAARPTAPAPTPIVGFDSPTDKQLAYAKSIASRKKLDIPAGALRSKRELSAWIDQNRA